MDDYEIDYSHPSHGIEMALKVHDDFVQCFLLDVSESGVTADITGGHHDRLRIGSRGVCIFDYLDESFEGECTVSAIKDHQLFLDFNNLDEDQLFFIRSLMEELDDPYA